MLIDPLVLKKKLNRMATEQGSFAILSSLLLYVTELSAGDPQISNKRTKWAEGKENKVSSNQPCPGPIRIQHPTRFQLLRSRFLNNNREPYTKKRREVGKLVIKEKLWVSRAGNKLDRSRDRKGDEKAADEDADTAPSDRARWSSMTGKNTVKNILKKFLAAEEKEAKEKSPSWKKNGANSCLPKIVNRSSVLSKLKEQFEQNALCSAAEVKALPLRKGEKKTKNFPSRKTIHKPEVRVLRMAAMTATGIKSPESQNLVCSTVPVPRLSMATKINHPWSWSKNNATKQPSGHDTLLKEKEGSNRDCDESKMLANAAQDRKDREDREELLVALEAMSDEKDCAETKIDSINQELNFHPVLDNSSTTYENKALADRIVPLSECSLDSDRNNMPAATDTSSLLGITNALQHIKEDSLPSDSPYSNTAKGSHEQSPQDTTLGEIPEITMYVYTSEEYDTELTEPEKDPFFPRQKCSPEQKVLENILPLHSPGVQASCEVEPPMDARQLTVLIPASGKKPPIVQKEALDLGGQCSEEGKEEAKVRSEDKFSLTSSKNNGDVPNTEEEENKAPNSQMQNEYKTTQPQLPQITFMPQNNFDDSNANISNSDANQKRPTVSSNENQVPKPGTAEEEYISPPLDKTQSPLPGDLVKHSSYIAEDFGKDKLSSTNEMMNHANNRSLHRSIVTDLETCHKPSKSFIQHEETTADEMPWPDSETWQSPLSTPLSISLSEMAGQSIHHTLRSPPALPPMDLVKQGAGGVGHEHTSHGCGEQSPRPSDDLTNCGNDTTVEKKATSDFKNQTLSSNHATEDENSTDKETNTCQRFENCLSLSTKKPEKHENKTILARKPVLPLEKNQTSPVDDTKKQGCDMLEENPIPLLTELVSNQKKHEKSRKKISEHTRDKPFSSDDDMKHESDRMETEEKEERNVLHKFDPEQIFPPNATVDHDNSSSKENNVHRPQTSQLPSSEHDINIQGVKNTGQSLEDPAPSRDFVKHENDMTGDENICCNNRKSHLASSDEPMKLANDSAGLKNSKSNFNNYSMPPRITSRQDNKTTDEDNSSLETEMSPGDFVKPEIKLDKKETKHTSVKLQSPSSYKVPNHQDRSSSEERKQKTPAAEDNRSTETKVVKEDNEHQLSGKHQLPLSRKSEMHEENIAGGDKQQMRSEGFPTPDKNTAKQKDKFPSSRKYQSLSSETLVKPQAKNTPEQMQQTSASSGFKKPGTNVKEKDGDPNPEKSPSSNIVLKPQEKSSSGERKRKTPVAEDTRSHEEKAAKEDSKYQCSGKHQLPPSNELSKPEKNVEGGKNTKSITKSFTKSDANVVKDKNRDPNSGMGQSPYSNLLMKPQENNATDKKEQSPPSHDKNPMYKTGSPEKKSESKRREKYQLGSSAHSEKQSSDGSGEKGPVCDLMSYQAPLPSNSKNCKSSTVPKKTSLSHTEKSPKSSSSFHVASKDEENPAGNRKNLPGFKKYKVLSSKTLVRHENDAAEREGTWQAAGKTSDKKAELEDCSKATPFSKYTVESYSEGPLDSAFKPLIIRVTDTFKHHS